MWWYCREKVFGIKGQPMLVVGPAPEGTQDDCLLAQMLQLEFDKEHDLQLQAEEKHLNRHSQGL